MTTLVRNKSLCVGDKLHTPNNKAISVVAYSFSDADYFTFCEVCEQNISSSSFYDEDRGTVYTKWVIE
jgi:predicted Fe-Mo cluster-binding NifX family protein